MAPSPSSYFGYLLRRMFPIKKPLQESKPRCKLPTETPPVESVEPSLCSAPWDELPDDLVGEIALKLDIGNCIRMTGVCRSWDRIISTSDEMLALMQKAADSQIPWMLEPHFGETDFVQSYSMSEERGYEFRKPKLFTDFLCCGTSNGWLIMIDDSTYDPPLYLWNPISGESIRLPSLATVPFFKECLDNGMLDEMGYLSFIPRVEVFSVADGRLVVAAILGSHTIMYQDIGQKLVFCTPDEEEEDAIWTVFSRDGLYYDMLFHKEKLHVVGCPEEEEEGGGTFQVHSVNLVDDNCGLGLELPVVLIEAVIEPRLDLGAEDDEELYTPNDVRFSALVYNMGWLHLAKSINGELLFITRYFAAFGFLEEQVPEAEQKDYIIHNETRDFKVEVVKFEEERKCFEVSRCDSLDGQALFVGSSGGCAYKSDIYRDCIWFLPSGFHIYDSLQSNDSGVFYLQEKKIKRPFPSVESPLPSNLGWFTPKLA